MPTNFGLQQNNYSQMGLGQPQQGKNAPRRSGFLDDIGHKPEPIFESVAPGIPQRTVDSTLNHGYGQPAATDNRSYIQNLLGNGPATPQSLAAIEPQLQQRGIQLQKNSAGDIRGRAYLPNPGGYQYGNAVDLVSQWGQPWSYTERHEDAPSLPKKAPANEIYKRAQLALTPIQDNNDELQQMLMRLMMQNQESI